MGGLPQRNWQVVRRVEGSRVSALAEQLAANPLVRSQLVRPASEETLAPLVHSTQAQSGITSVTVADADGRIVSSTNPTVVGDRLPLGAGPAEARGWSGSLTLDGSRELVAQVPVLGATQGDVGSYLGTVMIGEASPTVWQRLSGASSYLLAYLGIASGLGVAGSPQARRGPQGRPRASQRLRAVALAANLLATGSTTLGPARSPSGAPTCEAKALDHERVTRRNGAG